jgi:hypothetical protein
MPKVDKLEARICAWGVVERDGQRNKDFGAGSKCCTVGPEFDGDGGVMEMRL